MPDNYVVDTIAFASDDVSGTQYPRVKQSWGADGAAVDTSEDNPLPVAGQTLRQSYWPGYTGPSDSAPGQMAVDDSGALITRGAVTTDEGTFRVNFANTSLAVSIGAVTIVGDTVTGTGFLASDVHYKDYFKLDADGESAWVGIASIDSNTQIKLRAAYVGGSSGAASRTLVRPVTGSGGAISVASGQATMTTGTTANAITRLVRDMDFAPLVGRTRVSVSQRIVNQSFRIGLTEAYTVNDRWFARFLVDGTTATTVKCESARNPTTIPSAAETETTTITLPGGITTASNPEYRIEQLTESVRFYVNGVVVAEHTRAIPAQHDAMEFSVTCVNGASAPASSTTVVVDYMTGKNHNKLEVGVMSDAEKIVAAAVPLQQFTYNVAGVIAINTDLMVLDCSQLRSLFIQCNSMGTTGVSTGQWSNTPDFAQPITATLLNETGAASTTFNAAGLRVANVMARYFRLRLTTATTAGTTTLNVWGAQTTYTPIITTQTIAGTVTANIGTGSVAAGTNAIGDVGLQVRANATGAASVHHVVAAASTNVAQIKAAAGRVLGWDLSNTTSSWRYVKLHNVASATAGAGVVKTIGIPPNGLAQSNIPVGLGFATAISRSIVTGAADADATVTAANDVVGDIYFA